MLTLNMSEEFIGEGSLGLIWEADNIARELGLTKRAGLPPDEDRQAPHRQVRREALRRAPPAHRVLRTERVPDGGARAMSTAATISDNIAFSKGLRPARNPATGKLIDTVDEARTILTSAGVPLDAAGLPVQKDNDAARRLLSKASSWIDERGNLVDTPEKSPRCFGLSRFVKLKACRACKFKRDCRAVMGARLTFGGAEEFKRLRKVGQIDWNDVAVLAAISAIMGWESQHEAIAIERSRRKARERKPALLRAQRHRSAGTPEGPRGRTRAYQAATGRTRCQCARRGGSNRCC